MWWVRYSVNGRQEREPLGTDDEALAVTLAQDILADPTRKLAQNWERELGAYLRARTAARRMSKNTARNREAILKRFAADRAITTPAALSTATVRAWYRELQTQVEESSAQSYVKWLRAFCDWLVAERKIRRNPVEVEMSLVRQKMRKAFCSAKDVRKLIDSCADEQLRFVLYAGFHCGLRKEEIIQARPEWFDLRRGLLHVQRSATWEPKDRDDRTIPLTKEFVAFLRGYGLHSPFMIEPKKKEGGRWRYRYDFGRPFLAHMKAQGFEWVTAHTMRRTFASLKVSAGVSLYKVAVWIGDLEKVVQDHYGFLLPKDADIERGL